MLSRQCQLQKYCGNLNNIVLAVLFVDHIRVEQNKIGLKAQKGSDLDRALLQPKEQWSRLSFFCCSSSLVV